MMGSLGPEGVADIMNNPMLARLAEGAPGGTGGGEMPDLSALLSDPNIANMAKQFMRGNQDSE